MKTLFFYLLGLILGTILGVTGYWMYSYSNIPEMVSAYDIKHEYATTKVTTRLSGIEKCKFKNKEDGYKATLYLCPEDWHQRKIPKKTSMIFSGIEEGWGVQVDNQVPETEYPAAHLYIKNKPTREFLLSLDKPTATYEWQVVLYPETEDADPNFNPENIRVHFDWKIERIK